jgi:adenylate kinase family enzyme
VLCGVLATCLGAPPPAAASAPLQPLCVIITGAPASGKGTQCERLVERFGLVHLSTGDMLRAAVKAGSAVGVQADGCMRRGELVPDDVIIGIVVERLREQDCTTRGWLLDGFPRSAPQARRSHTAAHLNWPDVRCGRRADLA